MSITPTTSTATYSVANGSWTYKLYVTETAVDDVLNQSTVTCRMAIYRANGTYSYIDNGKYALKVTLNGSTQTSSTITVNKTTSQPEVSVVTLTFTVDHNDDGSGTAQITYCQFISSGGTAPSTSTLGSMPKNYTLTKIDRASEITCSDPITMASSTNITVTQMSSGFSHILYYHTGTNSTLTEIGRYTATKTYSWTVYDNSSALPNSASDTYTLQCYTYTSNDYTGDPIITTVTVTANVPTSYVPTISFGTITEGNSNVPASFPFITNYSKLVVPTTANGSHGSTISGRTLQINNEILSNTGSTATVSLTFTQPITSTSTTVSANVLDSRGRVGTNTTTVSATAYSDPSITIDVTRADGSGNASATGTYALVRAIWSYSSVNSLNSANIKVYNGSTQIGSTYTPATTSQSTYTQVALVSGFSTSSEYTITATITDLVTSSSDTGSLTKAQMPFTIYDDKAGNMGISIGRMATQGGLNNYLDLGLLTGNDINLYNSSDQVIDTMTTDELFNPSVKFVKGSPIYLYDTDGETVLYSRNPENLLFYNGNGWLYTASTTYSTDEIQVGQWINDKPLYRKVIDVGTLPNNSAKNVAHNISNLGVVVRMGGYFTNGTNTYPMPNPAITSSYTVAVTVTSTNVTINTGTDRTSYSGYVILEYTKTTD